MTFDLHVIQYLRDNKILDIANENTLEEIQNKITEAAGKGESSLTTYVLKEKSTPIYWYFEKMNFVAELSESEGFHNSENLVYSLFIAW